MKGLDSLLRKLDALGGEQLKQRALKEGVAQAAAQVQGDAKMLCPVNDGQLRNSIQTKTHVERDKVVGVVSTNVEHAPYVEFGTGPVGQASATDLPPEIAGSIHYKQDGWWIHESQIDSATAEKYRFFKLETKNGVFYYTEGQPAQPFLYPAIRRNEDEVRRIIAAKLKDEIVSVVSRG